MGDIVERLKSLKCDPGPVHSPNECDFEQPCPCVVQAEAADTITSLRSEREALLKCAEALKNIDAKLVAIASADDREFDDGDDCLVALQHAAVLATMASETCRKALALLSLGNSDSTGVVTVDRTALPHRKGE